MNELGYEVDFIPVGDDKRSGDAIAIRYGHLRTNPVQQTVIIIDGGFSGSGEKLVEHVKEYYGADTVDLLVNTHPDSDHISGLTEVLEGLTVERILMHQPWRHTNGINNMFADGRVTDQSVKDALKMSLEQAMTFEQLAKKKGIPIDEPFAGMSYGNGAFTVIGPTKDYYESLLPGFRGTPEAKDSNSLLDSFFQAVKEQTSRVAETLHIETLTDDGETSAENNSGVISLLNVGDEYLLFTADAGIPALTAAAEFMETRGINLGKIKFIQVPHHGSKRNVGPTILNRLIGSKLGADEKIKSAFVSTAKNSDSKHPAKKVTNAFRRRGAPVYQTGGNTLRHHKNAPSRVNWSAVDPIRFHNEVDD